MYRNRRQRGAVLIVSLLLLVAMTLLGVATINSSTVNLMVVGNLQSQKAAEAAAQEGIEVVLSGIQAFEAADGSFEPFQQPVSGDQVALIERVECRNSAPADGYSATLEVVPEDNTWEVVARHTAPDGAEARVRQGVRIRQTMGLCP